MIIESDVRTSQFFALARKISGTLANMNHNFTVRHRGEILLIPAIRLTEFAFAVMECVFTEEFVTQTDGDVLKQAVQYAKVRVL